MTRDAAERLAVQRLELDDVAEGDPHRAPNTVDAEAALRNQAADVARGHVPARSQLLYPQELGRSRSRGQLVSAHLHVLLVCVEDALRHRRSPAAEECY